MALGWMDGAACARQPDFLDRPQVRQFEVCAGCPVREACAEYGIRHIDVTGRHGTVTYGGMTPAEVAAAHVARRGPLPAARERPCRQGHPASDRKPEDGRCRTCTIDRARQRRKAA